jgi:glycosyltransferase involved in cell wall biosynthesis
MKEPREIKDRKVRVFTCTPVDFAGDESFFSRESGMFCRGLRSIGVDSLSIMPGPARLGDDPLLIRTDAENLSDAAWWRGLGLDAVILYSWAAPRYTSIAVAIKKAGISLMVCMDTCGVISPQANSRAWFHDLPKRILLERPFSKGKIRDLAKYLVESLASPIARARIHHYRQADIVTVPTPEGADWVSREALSLGDACLASKIRYLPHPQSSALLYDGTKKEKLVITIARWELEDWPQKNPRVLLGAYRTFLAANPDWRGFIVGTGATRLLEKLRIPSVPGLEFQERVDTTEIPKLFNRASIGFWSSNWEGQQGTGAQALCCGCSVVSHLSPMMNCFSHYVSKDSGRLAHENTPKCLANALMQEAEDWECGRRNPRGISEKWMGEFHANSVASKAIEYLNHSSNIEKKS